MADALLIVDFQNDFTPGGALGVEGGDEIAPRVNELAASGRFDLVVASRDWHPPHHSSFEEQGGIWPVHCVQGTEGAELHPSLDRDHVDIVYEKGQRQETDGYSNFETLDLHEMLQERGVDRLTVAGLATDYCVKHSVLDARRLGYEVDVVADAIRAVDREPGDGERAIEAMRAAGANVS